LILAVSTSVQHICSGYSFLGDGQKINARNSTKDVRMRVWSRPRVGKDGLERALVTQDEKLRVVAYRCIDVASNCRIHGVSHQLSSCIVVMTD
jgi:hypothetical protein